ncbi:MAG TPA: hypothetical protein VGM44_19370 [Polyangiaceae bacterium]
MRSDHNFVRSSSAGGGSNGGSAGAVQNDAWVGTWSGSAQSGGDSFQDKILRQVVHNSISGTSARVQLSNAFGSKAIDVKDVHIAKRTSGSSIDPASDRAVKFGTPTNYLASGNVSGNPDLANKNDIGSYCLLANLDVKNTPEAPHEKLVDER